MAARASRQGLNAAYRRSTEKVGRPPEPAAQHQIRAADRDLQAAGQLQSPLLVGPGRQEPANAPATPPVEAGSASERSTSWRAIVPLKRPPASSRATPPST